jgi:hypothetical protein
MAIYIPAEAVKRLRTTRALFAEGRGSERARRLGGEVAEPLAREVARQALVPDEVRREGRQVDRRVEDAQAVVLEEARDALGKDLAGHWVSKGCEAYPDGKEYDVVSVEGDELYFGQRITDMCKEDGRPAALTTYAVYKQ